MKTWSFNKKHRHDWQPWGELTFVGSEYDTIPGDAYYRQTRRCASCNQIEVRTVRSVGAGNDIRRSLLLPEEE